MVTEPESMGNLIYMTRRADDKLKIMAWVYKKKCPECDGSMSKPKDEKTGRPKIRATEYVCGKCGYSEEKKAHEESLTLEAKYTCPHCGKEGTGETQYKRKTIDGVPSYLILCEHCGGKIPVTKKMKEAKKK
ncbi:hypothetical protein ACFLZ7_01155 [Nanoarchaeota archaeon]